MLVLRRRKGERIMIGHDVVVEVVELYGHTVKLGIIAPTEVEVHREEIYIVKKQNGDFNEDRTDT